jgi:hypothetical protein
MRGLNEERTLLKVYKVEEDFFKEKKDISFLKK